VILCSHLRFRKALARERLLNLPMRLRAHPILTLVGIALLVAILMTTFFVDGLRWSIPAFAVFLGLITLMYFRNRESKVAR